MRGVLMPGLIHVGAHSGIEYVDETRPLVLIEPQAEVFRALVDTFGGRSNVILRNTACGDRKGTAVMRVATFGPSSSLLPPREHLTVHPETSFKGRERVSLDTLDHVMASIGNGYSELVIDTQGYEMRVLKGATKTLEHIGRVKIEVNTVEMFKGCPLLGEIDDWFDRRGFQRVELDLETEGHGFYGDAIYERRRP